MNDEKNLSQFSRRDFIKTTAAASFAANIIGCSKKARKPNLLFIWTDEQRADTMQVYGNPKIHAPNMNKLAGESVVFQRAYVSQTVCTPSRSTVMTGLWPHENSCRENNIPLPDNVACFPEIVNDPDYRTGYFGKWHLGDEVFPQHGFEEWEPIEDGYWKYYRQGRDRRKKSAYWHFLHELGYKPDTSRGDYSRGFAAHLPIEHSKPKFLEIKACDFLRRHKDEPFMLYVNFLEPHMPFFGPLNDEHDVNKMALPENFNDPLEDNEPLRYRLLRENYRRKGFGGNDLMTQAGWRRLITNYWGLVTEVDRSVGIILKTLEDLGLADDTIVVYTSDHGDMMGAHQLLAKTVMYEEAAKVPWLMRIPQLGRKLNVIKEPVSHIDLVPTLLDLMHVKAEKPFTGKSLVPTIQGEAEAASDVFIEWNPAIRHGRTPPSIAGVSREDIERVNGASVRTIVSQDGWKLCLCDKDKNQLFNLNKDPYETTNLYDSGNYRDIISRLTKGIAQWQEKVKDDAAVI